MREYCFSLIVNDETVYRAAACALTERRVYYRVVIGNDVVLDMVGIVIMEMQCNAMQYEMIVISTSQEQKHY